MHVKRWSFFRNQCNIYLFLNRIAGVGFGDRKNVEELAQYREVKVNKARLNILLFIFLLFSFVLFSLGAFATYEKKVYLNFYNGHFRSQKSIFYFLPIGREEGRNETVLKFFSQENRNKIPDRWFYHWTINRDGRLHTRMSGGLGAAIMKIIQSCDRYRDQLSDADREYVRLSLIKILNADHELESTHRIRDLEDRIQSVIK